jgi:hypothetical protein
MFDATSPSLSSGLRPLLARRKPLRPAVLQRTFSAAALGCVLFTLGESASATEVGRTRPIGFGFALGDPAALVAKYFVSPANAWDFGLGIWTFGGTALSLNVDYLWQEQLVRGRSAGLDWHIGAGGRVWAFESDFALAARMPLGLDVTFRRPNFLEVFLDIAPAVYILPGVGLDIEAQLGVRLYP